MAADAPDHPSARHPGTNPLSQAELPGPPIEASGFTVRYQPILDVARGVAAGYQAQVVEAAGGEIDVNRPWPLSHDCDGMLTAAVIRTALAAFATLPANTFLTVPLPVELAGREPVRRALMTGMPQSATRQRPLSGVVLDLVGPIDLANRDSVEFAVAPLRTAGAMLSVGGYGAPQPELSSILTLRPSIIRLGRDWVRGVDTSTSKRSALEAIGLMADQLDAWVLVEGVGTADELHAIVDLAVPLAQGSFVGNAQTVWPGISVSVQSHLPRVTATGDGTLRSLLQAARTVTDPAALTAAMPQASGIGVVVVLGEDGRPTTVIEQDDNERWCAWEAMTVHVDTTVNDVVMRALTRPRASRFAPIVCTDETGRLLGVLRMERLVSHLATSAAGATR